MKHSNLYLGLVLPSGGRQSLIDSALLIVYDVDVIILQILRKIF